MVRLKVAQYRSNKFTRNISIPYGAIKSEPATEKEWLFFNISIPYGAIKSLISMNAP